MLYRRMKQKEKNRGDTEIEAIGKYVLCCCFRVIHRTEVTKAGYRIHL